MPVRSKPPKPALHRKLHLLYLADPKYRNDIIEKCEPDLIMCLEDCCWNSLYNSTMNISKENQDSLRKSRKTIKKMANPKIPLQRKKELLVQTGGSWISSLLAGVLDFLK